MLISPLTRSSRTDGLAEIRGRLARVLLEDLVERRLGGETRVQRQRQDLQRPRLAGGEAEEPERIAWERAAGWLPTFTCTVDSLVLRGTICAPFGRDADVRYRWRHEGTRLYTVMVRELFPRMIIMDEGQVVADGLTECLMDDIALLEAHGLERP